MQLADQLHAAGVAVFPCRADKAPAVGKGESWFDYAAQPPCTHFWPSGLVGIPIPAGALVIDLDTYKGATREAVEALLGCSLPWDAALIQTTQQGGQHYAFSVDWPARQGSSLNGLRGFDTRAAGKGYIATGSGYVWHGWGPYCLAHPHALPRLPDAARAVLEHTTATDQAPAPRPGDKDVQSVLSALRALDPGCTRTDWVKIGLALRHHFHDDEASGYALFESWSSGELWTGEAPPNYVAEHVPAQWATFKPDGATTIGTLFYEAIRAGWLPPATLDTAAAFGAGAAPAGEFRALVDRIQAHGCDPAYTLELTEAVQQLVCAPLQRAALLATLNRELKDAGLLTKAVRTQLDDLAGATSAPRAAGQYGKNHTENALHFLEAHYPDRSLVRCDEVFYHYDGRCWCELPDSHLRHQLAIAMTGSWPQHSTITGTFSMIAELTHTAAKIGDMPPNLVLFQNGVLDLFTGQLGPHHPCFFTTNIMPYNFNPGAQCPTWLAFLYDIFEGDLERIALLQEWFGYMLSAGYAYHKVMLMLGPKRSGKGTIGKVLAQVVGPQNFSGGSFTAFCSDAYIDSLRTKPVVFMGDAEARVSQNYIGQVIERIKTISGNDVVTFGRKYKSTLSETLPSRITIASNSVPKLFDDSGALASRLLVLPFEVSYIDREDPTLIDKLLVDLEGIAVWSLQGMARLNQQGHFTSPAASEAEQKHIAETYSPIEHFIDDVCELGGEAVLWSEEAYDVYRRWAIAQQESHILARRTFVNAFKDATRGRGCKYGVHRRDEIRSRGFKGLAMREMPGMTESAFTPREVSSK